MCKIFRYFHSGATKIKSILIPYIFTYNTSLIKVDPSTKNSYKTPNPSSPHHHKKKKKTLANIATLLFMSQILNENFTI